jgi:GntR family transcriptional regulator / MocR family aminotransferase
LVGRTLGTVVTLAPREPGTSAFRWLCSGLRAAILDGRWPPGARLPSTRELAAQYALARGTVVTAYEQLAAEGYVEPRTGSGSYVCASLPDALLTATAPRLAASVSAQPPRRRLSSTATRTTAFPATTNVPARAFRTNEPALGLFPTTLWAQVAGRRWRRAGLEHLRVGDVAGYGPLREAIAAYLVTARGVVCGPEQVVVVSGVQEALDLIARVLLDPGDRVCMENPGYVGAARTFDAAGAEVVGLPVDAEGAALPGGRTRAVRLVYLTPGHQFPLGVTMSLSRRLAFLEWAARTGAMILEDDYDSEYRFSGAPVPALQGLDRHGRVIFTGSFSKVLFPSLRLGYLVLPSDLVDRISAAKSIASRGAPLLDQAILTDFLVEGHFGRHVRRMRGIYAERLGVLLESARQNLADHLEFSAVEAGLQTTAWLRPDVDGRLVAEAAARRGVEVMPLSRYSRAPLARDGLVMGFAAVDPAEIRRGVHDLAAALATCLAGDGHRSKRPRSPAAG